LATIKYIPPFDSISAEDFISRPLHNVSSTIKTGNASSLSAILTEFNATLIEIGSLFTRETILTSFFYS
jgi:hypothetical protein